MFEPVRYKGRVRALQYRNSSFSALLDVEHPASFSGMDKLETWVGLIAALSVASERLVETIKNTFRGFDTVPADAKEEAHRKMKLQFIGFVAGIITVLLAQEMLKDMLPQPIYGRNWWLAVVGLGFLASGGSGFWNGILGYVREVKDLKKAEKKALGG